MTDGTLAAKQASGGWRILSAPPGWLASFGCGLVAATGFAPLDFVVPAVLALFVLATLIARAGSLGAALARGWWFGLGYFTLGNNWIATAFTYQAAMPAWLGWIAVMMLALYLAIFPAAAAGLAWRYGRRGPPIVFNLIFAAAWIVTEWLRGNLFTGFAWNPLAAIIVDVAPLAAWAKLIGTYGLSGILILLMCLPRLPFRQFLACLLLLLGGGMAVRSMGADMADAQPPRVTIVQPNIGQQDKWRDGYEDIAIGRLARLSAQNANSGAGPRLILWPEAAITQPLVDGRAAKAAEVQSERRLTGSAIPAADQLLTGGLVLESRDGVLASSAANSAFLMDRSGRISGRYDKAHLVPYGEYLPMRGLLEPLGLSRLAPGDMDFAAGPGPRNIIVPGVGPVGLQICYEIIFSGQVVDPGQRPRFLFNPSNDAWFGRWGPPQHLAQGRLRALEEGIPVLRSTPTGISAVIDGRGKVLAALPWQRAGAIHADVPPLRTPTPFSRLGNLAAFLFAGLLLAIAFAVRRVTR